MAAQGAAGLGGSCHARLFIACPAALNWAWHPSRKGVIPRGGNGMLGWEAQMSLPPLAAPPTLAVRNVSHCSDEKTNVFKVLPRQCKMGYFSSPVRIRAKISLERLLVQSIAHRLLPTQSKLLPKIHLPSISYCSMPWNLSIPRLFTSPIPHPQWGPLCHSASPASPDKWLLAAGHVPILNKVGAKSLLQDFGHTGLL